MRTDKSGDSSNQINTVVNSSPISKNEILFVRNLLREILLKMKTHRHHHPLHVKIKFKIEFEY